MSLRGALATKQSKTQEKQRDCFPFVLLWTLAHTLAMTVAVRRILKHLR